MARKPESLLVKKIRLALKKEVGGWWFKVWGGAFQMSGVPDLVGCVEGLFFGLEVKTKTGTASPIQIKIMKDIVEKGGGVALVVRTPQEAVDAVIERLEETR